MSRVTSDTLGDLREAIRRRKQARVAADLAFLTAREAEAAHEIALDELRTAERHMREMLEEFAAEVASVSQEA